MDGGDGEGDGRWQCGCSVLSTVGEATTATAVPHSPEASHSQQMHTPLSTHVEFCMVLQRILQITQTPACARVDLLTVSRPSCPPVTEETHLAPKHSAGSHLSLLGGEGAGHSSSLCPLRLPGHVVDLYPPRNPRKQLNTCCVTLAAFHC